MRRQRILGEAEGFTDFCVDPKELQSFVELEKKEVQSSDDDDDEIADSESSDEEDDEEEDEPSHVSGFFMRHEVKGSAAALKDCPDVVLLCREILKYFTSKYDYDDADDDVKDDSFVKMAGQVLAHDAFKNFLRKHCQFKLYNYDVVHLGRENESNLKTANHLSLIKQDRFLDMAIKQREHWFFETTLGDGDDEMVVRGAMSIVIPYFITLDYLKNNGILVDFS